MKSRTEIKREVIQAGGTIDDAYKIIHARKLYMLRHSNGTYLRAETTSNEGKDFCGAVTVDLYNGESDPLDAWHTPDAEAAEFVRQYPPAWWNAGPEIPRHSYAPEELMVVSMAVLEPEPVEVTIPSLTEYLTRCYGPKGRAPNARHLEYCLTMVASGQLKEYGWSEYSMLKLDEEKKKKAIRTTTNG